jgi:signal transduction histidine kinase
MAKRKSVVPLQVTIGLVALLCLIPPFAWLQYQWADMASRAEEQQMRENLRATGRQFFMTLDNEVTVFHDMLEAERGAATAVDTRTAVEQAVAFWTGNASWPELLSAVSVVSVAGEGTAGAAGLATHTYTRQTGASGKDVAYAWREVTFEKADATLAAAILSLPIWQGAANGASGKSEMPAFAFQRVVSIDPPVAVITQVDPAVLAAKVLPALASRYFGEPDGLRGYTVRVVASAGGAPVYSDGNYREDRAADLRVPLLGNFRIERSFQGKRDSRVQDFPRVRYWLQSNDRPPPAPERSPWTLEVQRTSGSFEEATAKLRLLNLGGSLGLLVIITAGLGWLYRLYRQTRVNVRTQEDFVATVSHELKTPLSILRSAAENLREGVVTDVEHTKRYGERMVGEANRLLSLTENVLFYARLEAGAAIPEHRREQFALDQLLRETVQSWKSEFSAADAQLSFHSTVLDDSLFWGEKTAIAAMVHNLLSNARRYGLPEGGGGRVEVLLSQRSHDGGRFGLPVLRHRPPAPKWLLITVKDNGPGIPIRERRRLFQPFFRPSSSPTGGIGLGLSLVRRIANAHGGKVWVEGSGGAGIAFVVELPHGEVSE